MRSVVCCLGQNCSAVCALTSVVCYAANGMLIELVSMVWPLSVQPDLSHILLAIKAMARTCRTHTLKSAVGASCPAPAFRDATHAP